MMLSQKLSIACLTATLATAALALNVGRDVEIKSPPNDRCVYGVPTADGGYTIDYQKVRPASAMKEDGYVLDKDWIEKHKIGDSSHYFAGISQLPWVENKCQYTCNAMKECVSFVGYQTKDSTARNSEIYGHFFDALIESNIIVGRSAQDPFKMTHAYNKLCEQDGH